MGYKTVAKNGMLDFLGTAITQASLHSGFPATDGNELAGGDYERLPVAFGAASGGEIARTGTAPVFAVPAGSTVVSAGFRASDGTLLADDDIEPETYGSAGTFTMQTVVLDLNT